jgi:kynurenine formamidase
MQIIEAARDAQIYDLSQPYFIGMPHFPTHPPFLFSLTKLHGDVVNPGGGSSAADTITFGGHTGTHIDALSHFSCGGRLFGGVEAKKWQSYGGGMSLHSIDTVAPIVRRGVLLDIAGLQATDILPPDFVITPEHLDRACAQRKISIGAGDVVLLRTGWARHFADPRKYIGEGSPGPELAGAKWLSERGVFAAGSDTLVFERYPNPPMPVHVHLLVDSGIHIIEVLNLEELSRDAVSEFLFVGAPLKVRGGTGAPTRPLALVTREG